MIPYHCGSEQRRLEVKGSTSINGIDYLEVVTVDQRTLEIRFLNPLPGSTSGVPTGPELTADNIRIDGGERVVGVRVTDVDRDGRVLSVHVDRAGDFSTYTFRLVASPTDMAPPDGFDPALSEVFFSFKVACPTDFDCLEDTVHARPSEVEPDLNYLAKDYTSFVALLEGRLRLAMPGWNERNPADVVVTVLEALAHAGDVLSYRQDAVAAEAYLSTARSRISVRRHARLLNYRLHDGCNARTWLAIDVTQGSATDGDTVPAGTTVVGRGVSTGPTVPTTADLSHAVVFETMHPVVLQGSRSTIPFHTWSEDECCLPRGSTRATLVNDPDAGLTAGDVLLLVESRSPTTGLEADADPAARHAVRLTRVTTRHDPVENTKVVEVEWSQADALPFDLRVSARIASDEPSVETAVAKANVVLVDAGRTVVGRLAPPAVPAEGAYRPTLRDTDVTVLTDYRDEDARLRPARDALRQDPRRCLPVLTLDDGDTPWTPLPDLLGAPRFAPNFVVETEQDGVLHLRFGGKPAGRRPSPGTAFTAHYRVGNGPSGNVGADVLTTLTWDEAGITAVTNPLPAVGGTAPESMAQARAYAPAAFKVQQRAVTEADYVEVAQRHPEVQRAAARIRWTGSWYTAYVTIDRRGGTTLRDDPQFAADLRRFLDAFRVAGYDVELADPTVAALDLELSVCVLPGYFRAHVKQALLAAFTASLRPDGRPGFFHPDRWSFGEPLYASAVYDTALAVPGVESARLTTFQRFGRRPAGELAAGVITTAPLEVLRLDNDPSSPEHGRLLVETEGGL
ncbi:MAG: baseplate J/gp47 family protein [Nocardioides sp.]